MPECRETACVTTHNFNHHNAVVRLGGGVNLVDRVSRGGHGGVEAESDVGGAEIVVDGLRNCNDLHALMEKFESDFPPAVAAHRDNRVNA